jgi:hypothetical protein
MKTHLSRLALALAILIGAAACTPADLKAWWTSVGYDYSQKTEEEIAFEAFVWTLWKVEMEELNRFAWALDDGQLSRLRWCESTDNYGAVSSNGLYMGAYQFSQSTWNYVGSKYYGGRYVNVKPSTVPAQWQDAFTRALYAEQGRGPWPYCGRFI